jgi:hypothetical protein
VGVRKRAAGMTLMLSTASLTHSHRKDKHPQNINNHHVLKHNVAGSWRLMPVILATQGAEIRRIAVQSQPVQINTS